MVQIQYVDSISAGKILKALLLMNFLLLPTFQLEIKAQSPEHVVMLREDPQNPITADQIAKAKADLITSRFSYKDFYVGPEIGASLLMDVTGTARFNSQSVDGEIEANAGVRLDLPLGYTLSDFFAFEFSPGVIYNSLDSVNAGGFTNQLDGYILQVPLLVNCIWSFNTEAIRSGKSKIRPYFGGGVGAIFTYANLEGNNFGSLSISAVSSNTWSLGYQALAGMDYDFDENTSFGIRYEFTGTTNQNFSSEGVSISTGGLLSQNILLRMIHRF